MTDYEARLRRVFARVPRPTLPELVAEGADLDDRVTLPREADWEDLDVPEDTVPGE